MSSLDSASWRIILKKSSSFIHSHRVIHKQQFLFIFTAHTLAVRDRHKAQLGTQEVRGKQPCFSTCSTQLGPSHSRHSPIWWVSTYPIAAHKKGAEPTGVGYGKERPLENKNWSRVGKKHSMIQKDFTCYWTRSVVTQQMCLTPEVCLPHSMHPRGILWWTSHILQKRQTISFKVQDKPYGMNGASPGSLPSFQSLYNCMPGP